MDPRVKPEGDKRRKEAEGDTPHSHTRAYTGHTRAYYFFIGHTRAATRDPSIQGH